MMVVMMMVIVNAVDQWSVMFKTALTHHYDYSIQASVNKGKFFFIIIIIITINAILIVPEETEIPCFIRGCVILALFSQ